MDDPSPDELREWLEGSHLVEAACRIIEREAAKLLATWEPQGPCRPGIDTLLPYCPKCHSDEVRVEWETRPAERAEVLLLLSCEKFERVPDWPCRNRRVGGLTQADQAAWEWFMLKADHGAKEFGPEADEHLNIWIDLLLADEYKSPPPAEFPTLCQAGSPGKVSVLAEREERGQGLWSADDCRDLIDEGVVISTGRNGRVRRRGLENLLARMRQFRPNDARRVA